MEFNILKKSKKSRARLGVLKTNNGEVQTPCLVAVATQGVIKTLDSAEVEKTNAQILICNTFHLHLKPSDSVVSSSGGLHKFMNWKRPLMTDSGGFQVFSLGFGKDLNVGKIQKSPSKEVIKSGKQPKSLKITDKGVYFKSPLDGKELFIGPKESIKIQENLGADIILAFDECTSPLAEYEYIKKSLKRTHEWARVCLKEKKSKQALYGIVQGGRYKDLRKESAKFISSLPFDGFGIGGEFGDNKKMMGEMLDWVIDELPDEKPRHLLGIGYLEDIELIIKKGVDTFDCTVPTHYARRGIAFTSQGKLDLNKSKFLKDKTALDKKCSCFVCKSYKKNYLTHLLRAKEITALKLLTFHNLYFFNNFVKEIRERIKNGEI